MYMYMYMYVHISTAELCRDHEGTEYARGEVYYRQTFNASGAALDAAADVVVVVDESGSIYTKALWIREVLPSTVLWCLYTAIEFE